MNNGQACAIFKDIKSDKYTLNEKAVAIIRVLSMATDNAITKQDYRRALAWLWNEHFEVMVTEDNG